MFNKGKMKPEFSAGIGVYPDIEMSFAEGSFKDGEDTWLTRAVEYIHNGI
ncbi:MAG: hypothetical protein ACI3Y4_03580 [Candidatus Cryptobacteroides sp.]